MKKGIFIEIASYTLMMLFAYASINKLIDYDIFLKDLNRSPLLAKYSKLFSIIVPIIELCTCTMLIFEKTRKQGFISSVILMTLFTFYVGYVLFYMKQQPCSCGGIIRSLSWTNHLIFNITFLLIALTGLVFHYKKHKTHYA